MSATFGELDGPLPIPTISTDRTLGGAPAHLDTQRLAFIAEHVVLLAHVPCTGRWSLTIRGIDLPIMGGTLEEVIDVAREFHLWALSK